MAQSPASKSALWFDSLPAAPHILLAFVAAGLAGAFWAGIAGFLKATVGAHEVITTIMLNWIAYWAATYLINGGPLQDPVAEEAGAQVSRDIADSAKLPVIWGVQGLQGLHIGLFVALGALVVYSILVNRTTLGYEVRAVGFNPEAAAYGGISVGRSYVMAMAISGAFAGMAGAMAPLGLSFPLTSTSIQVDSYVAFPRHRRRAPRTQHCRRHLLRRAALRRAPDRDLDAQSRSGRLPSPAREQPHAAHPGAHRPLHRRRAARPFHLAGAEAAAARGSQAMEP